VAQHQLEWVQVVVQLHTASVADPTGFRERIWPYNLPVPKTAGTSHLFVEIYNLVGYLGILPLSW
jgi:hypothetical protein